MFSPCTRNYKNATIATMLNDQETIIMASPKIPDNISALPAGIIRHPEPLSNNHYILTSGDDIAPAAEISWRILQDRIANKDPNKQLVIAAFNSHPAISYTLNITNLLTRFALHQDEQPDDKSRRFIYAHELPYNELHDYARYAYRKKLPNEYKYKPNKIDPDNHILMKAIIANNIFENAPQTKNILFRTCLQHGINTHFNDVAKTHCCGYLDPNDPNIDLPRKHISCTEKDGMSIRNEFMAERILQTAKKDEIDIIIQGAGISHGGIKIDKDCPYEESYLKKCRDRGAEVTSIFLSIALDNYAAENVISEQALIDDPDMIIIDGVAGYKGFIDDSYMENQNLNLFTRNHSNPQFITPTDPAPTKGEVKELLNDIY